MRGNSNCRSCVVAASSRPSLKRNHLFSRENSVVPQPNGYQIDGTLQSRLERPDL